MSFPEETRDAFYRGRFALIQPKGWGFRAGLDALLLAATLPDGAKGRAVDMGSGTGAIGFALAERCAALELLLAERDAATAAMARRSIRLEANAAFATRLVVAEVDVLAKRPAREAAGLADGAFDFAVTNPPFHPPNGRPSPDARRNAALAMADADLFERWIAVAAALVRHGGLLALVARPENLGPLIAAAEGRFGDLRLLPVHTKRGEPATRILLHGRRGSRAPLRLLPSLALRDEQGAPQHVERAVAAGEARIDLGLA